MSDSNPASKPPWHTVIMICTKCEKRDRNRCTIESSNLKSKLKDRLKDLKPFVRVVESSCLGICPEGGVIQTVHVGKGMTLCAQEIRDSNELDALEAQIRKAL